MISAIPRRIISGSAQIDGVAPVMSSVRIPSTLVMPVGTDSVEIIVTAIQDKDVHGKGFSDLSSKETPLPLAPPTGGNRFRRRFWRWIEERDLDAVATQPSVFDDPVTLELYRPPQSYENTHRFDPSARWTFREERVRFKWCSHLSPVN
jgi:hypothetical protein